MRFYMIIAVMASVFVFLQYHLWFESGGIRDMMRLKRQLALEMKTNDEIKRSNEALLDQLKRMQYSQDATESRARNELGMVKQGETFYQVIK
ncbi:MAG TPA: septum formation initiator family protein [Gammaproteobacteria bacterium]|jgi:cell division protein FtsB|nr:septum formation initiator family protein [Gammaproteobacteria bacterium]